MLERAGIPEGLVRIVHGPGTGPALVNSNVAKIFFTGSVQTGRGVGEACARQLKGSVLELGGKDPMVVLADANLEHSIAGALWGGFCQRRSDLRRHRAHLRPARGLRAFHRGGGARRARPAGG